MGHDAGHDEGGRSLVGWVGPGTIIQNYNYITTVFYNLKNLNNLNNIINIIFILIQNLFKGGYNPLRGVITPSGGVIRGVITPP